MTPKKKYYEYYEDVYALNVNTGIDKFNNPVEKSFDELFDRSLLPAYGTVLDMGCGEGLYSVFFAAEGYDVTGVDISTSGIEWSRKRAIKHELSNVQFMVGDVTQLKGFTDNSFDMVLSLHCYHCLSDTKDRTAHLAEAKRLSRSGGIFIFENMASPSSEDMPRFRAWHQEHDSQVYEDSSGVITVMNPDSPFKGEVRYVALANRFYSRLEHVVNELEKLGFEILKAEYKVPDSKRIPEMNFIHGDNVIYARKK